MSLVALSGQQGRTVAPPGRLAISRVVALLQLLPGPHALNTRISLACWLCWTTVLARLSRRLAWPAALRSRLWRGLRLGAGMAWLCWQPAFAELLDEAQGWSQLNVVAAALFVSVCTPGTDELGRNWDDVLKTPLYPTDRPVRVAIYRRVSTPGQEEEGHGLDEQLDRANRHIEGEAWGSPRVYTEVFSGASARRPELRRLIKAVRAGEIDVVVIDRIDRLYRDLRGLLRVVQIFNEHHVVLVSVSERLGFDTAWGRLVLAVLGALAEFYLSSLSMETRKGKHARARLGLANGAYRLGVCSGQCSRCADPNGAGYCPRYGGTDLGDGRVPVHHPVEAQAVGLAYDWYETAELSDRDVARRLNARLCTLADGTQVPFRTKGRPGFSEPGPFTEDAVRYILTNPFYKGAVAYGGVKANGEKERKPVELFDGRHKPLVDEETWNRCQEIRQRRRHRPDNAGRRARVYPLSRLLFCRRCGRSMRGFSSNGGRDRYYGDLLFREKWRVDSVKGLDAERPVDEQGLAYGHQPNVRAEDVEAQVAAVVGQIALPLEWKRLILAYASEEDGLSAFHRRKLEVRERLQRANERYLSRVAPISRWQLERIEHECAADLAEIECMLPPGTTEPEVWRYLDDFGRLWSEATFQEQNELLTRLCSAVLVEDHQLAKIVAYPAFQGLLADAAGRAAKPDGGGREDR